MCSNFSHWKSTKQRRNEETTNRNVKIQIPFSPFSCERSHWFFLCISPCDNNAKFLPLNPGSNLFQILPIFYDLLSICLIIIMNVGSIVVWFLSTKIAYSFRWNKICTHRWSIRLDNSRSDTHTLVHNVISLMHVRAQWIVIMINCGTKSKWRVNE